MITVTFEKDGDGISGFDVFGHAGYAHKSLFKKRGVREYDLVCCAVSTLVFHTAGNLKDVCEEDIETSENEKTGFYRCIRKGEHTAEGDALIAAFRNSVNELSDQYGEKYLTVSER